MLRLNKEELKGRFPSLKKVIDGYKQPQEIVVFNDDPMDDNSDLSPIELNVFDLIRRNMLHWSPKATKKNINDIVNPNWSKVDGFGKKAEDQWFVPPPPPSQLLALEKQFKYQYSSLIEGVYQFWAEIESDPVKYRESVAFIEKQAYHFRYGYWCFINGRPTYIDGWHFRQLCTWKQGDFETRDKKTGNIINVRLPEYRDVNRRKFYFYKWCLVDTSDFEGNEYGNRTCLGYANPKTRQTGATADALTIIQDLSQTVMGSYSSMIGDQENTAKRTFEQKYLKGWEKQPIWLMPAHSQTAATKTNVNNTRPKSKNIKINGMPPPHYQLESYVDRADKTDRAFYDNATITGALLLDEEGKCLRKWTPIRMHSGEVKYVQDIQVGDLLMGPDSKHRKVTSICRGKEQMYDIIPKKKWETYGCNESHILSCKISDSSAWGKGYDAGDVINIDIKTYLGLPKHKKRGLCLYRVPVEYPYKEVPIDPYLLGIWLGDGSSRGTYFTLHNDDKEVINYIADYGADNGFEVKSSPNSKNSILLQLLKTNGRQNDLSKKLHKYNLAGNKHIPQDYLINSREVRLQLLAGLLDSDGHAFKLPKLGFEISQKRESLAKQIKDLADSLGIYVSYIEKVAKFTYKGEKKESLNYRLHMFGRGLLDVPTKLPRKQYPKDLVQHINTRDALKSGFDVVKRDVGQYYGFTLEENTDRLFLLGDYQVTHNTKSTDILEGWALIKPAMGGDSPRRFSFAMHPSTVEEMETGGGDKYFDLVNQSKYHEIKPGAGITVSGLRRVFFPSFDCLPGFIGKYGESLEEDLTPEQKKFLGKEMGSKEYLLSTFAFLEKSDDPEKKKELASMKRKYPVKFDDCWQIPGSDAGFNTEKLSKRIVQLKYGTYDKLIRKGHFVWAIGDRHYTAREYINSFGTGENHNMMASARVLWVEGTTPDTQRFHLSKIPTAYMMNAKRLNTAGDSHYDQFWEPSFPGTFTAAGDPFKYMTESQFKKSKHIKKLSKGGGTVFMNRDHKYDPDSRPKHEWQTYRFVCDYLYRTPSSDEYCEEMLMMCVYFSCLMFPEINVEELYKHFMTRGFSGYLQYDVDVNNVIKAKPGIFTSDGNSPVKDALFSGVRNYIENHTEKEVHLRILEQFIDIRGKEDMTNQDLFASAAINLRAVQTNYQELIEDDVESINLLEYFRGG